MTKGKKKSQIRGGIGISGFVVIITTVATVATSVVIAFLNPTNSDGTTSIIYTIVDRSFYISLSALIVEVLYNIFQIREITEKTAINIHNKDCIVFPNKNATLEANLEEAIKNTKTRKAQIICYGTSKFARVLEYLSSPEYDHIRTEAIVFSPDVSIFDFEKDKEKLRNVISSLASSKNITLYLCNILPTIRGAVFSSKSDSPLFCLIQPYVLNPSPKSSVLVMGKGVTPAMVASDEMSPILGEMAVCFRTEFERLKGFSTKYQENEQVEDNREVASI